MHAIVFVPAVVFVAVTAACALVCAVIDRRAAAAALRHRLAAVPPARPVFHPVLIQGGLRAPAANILRPAQSPLRLGGAGHAGAALAARSA